MAKKTREQITSAFKDLAEDALNQIKYRSNGKAEHDPGYLKSVIDRSSFLHPHICQYWFCYPEVDTLHSNGMSIITAEMADRSRSSKTDLEDIDKKEYIECIIEEQRWLFVYVLRQAVLDIFMKYSDVFRKKEGEYALYADLTLKIKDTKKREEYYWHAHHIIEPVIIEDDARDAPYRCTIILIKQTSAVPFSVRFGHRDSRRDSDTFFQDRNQRLTCNDLNKGIHKRLSPILMDILGWNENQFDLYTGFYLHQTAHQMILQWDDDTGDGKYVPILKEGENPKAPWLQILKEENSIQKLKNIPEVERTLDQRMALERFEDVKKNIVRKRCQTFNSRLKEVFNELMLSYQRIDHSRRETKSVIFVDPHTISQWLRDMKFIWPRKRMK